MNLVERCNALGLIDKHLADWVTLIEQLRAENAALKEQVADQARDLEEIKGSMAYRNSLFCHIESERDQLSQQLASMQRELDNERARDIHSCGPTCSREGCVNRRLRKQLKESQAREVKLRDALVDAANQFRQDGLMRECNASGHALALHSDGSALREALAKERESLFVDVLTAIQPDDSYQDDWFKAKADCYARVESIRARADKEGS